MKEQQLFSKMRQAMEQYKMIEEGDVVAVGISGGKDSLTLLRGMVGLSKFYPIPFQVKAITVDLGYEGTDYSEIKKLCDELGVEYRIEYTKINTMLPSENPCSLCARLRKGALNQAIKEMGCNKVAYAHHMDDVIETMMLSLIYEGRFSTFWPVTFLEGSDITLIRPMILVTEAEVIGFKNKYDLPVMKSQCDYEPETQRAYVKQLITEINRHTPGVKKRMMTAIRNGNLEGWGDKES